MNEYDNKKQKLAEIFERVSNCCLYSSFGLAVVGTAFFVSGSPGVATAIFGVGLLGAVSGWACDELVTFLKKASRSEEPLPETSPPVVEPTDPHP